MIPKKALIIVDVQNDFCAGGALSVPAAEEVIPKINRLQELFANRADLIVATQDWHPANHSSFAGQHAGKTIGDIVELQNGVQQTLWPEHCIQNTWGAAFHPALNAQEINSVFQKGIEESIDSYSAFYDNAQLRQTGLANFLREQNVEEVYVVGLATDYCVKYTALDSRKLGFKTFVVQEACRGVELARGDIQRAYDEMQEAGVQVI